MSGHPHAEAMRLYAEDAAKTEKPWELWQARHPSNFRWLDVDRHPLWQPTHEYRRKPTTKNTDLTPLYTADQLRAAVMGYRQDAERYRWLREVHWSKDELCVVKDPKKSVQLGSVCPSHAALDAAIDAARRQS